MSPVNPQTRVLIERIVWTVGFGVSILLLTRLARHRLLRGDLTIEARHKIRASIRWLGILGFVLVLAFIWAGHVQNLGVFLGIIGAGVALSMQETLLCIAGWLLLVIRRPYTIGDRIEVDGRIGDVIDISVFQTTMLEIGNWVEADQSTGRILIVPNSVNLRLPVYNYTKGFPFLWNEFSAVVTFESDWRGAKETMLEIATKEDEKFDAEVSRQGVSGGVFTGPHLDQVVPRIIVGIGFQIVPEDP